MGHHHRAIDDAICSAKIFVKLLSIAEKHGVCRAADLRSYKRYILLRLRHAYRKGKGDALSVRSDRRRGKSRGI